MNSREILDAISMTWNYTAVRIAVTILVAVLVQMFVRTTITRMVRRIVRGHKFASRVDEQKREDTLATIFSTASAVLLWTIVPIIILWQLHINLAALMTGAGLIGIVVGFGAQSAIKDFLAGVFVLAENQYRVGDIVTLRVAGVDISGVVEDITIRITRLRDLDGNMHIVQNGSSQVVTNRSFGFANVNIDVRVTYDTDINKIEKIMNDVGQAMANDPAWAGMIEEPIQFLRVDAFEESAVRVKALGKVEPAMQWDVAGEFRRRLKKVFEKNDIAIAYPQIILHQSKSSRK